MDDLSAEEIDLLLAQAHDPHASAESRARLERWMRVNPDHVALVTQIRLAENVLGDASRHVDVAAAWARHTQRTQTAPARVTAIHTNSARRPVAFTRVSPLRRIAAAAGVVAAGVAIGVFAIRSQNHATPTPNDRGIVYTTRAGQRATVTLGDGTEVSLGPATTVRTTSDGREVMVTGQALFNVTHVSDVPFTVHAGHTVTRVLGTTFAVRAYPGDALTTVAVRDGKVSVEPIAKTAARKPALLTAGDVVTLDSMGTATASRPVVAAQYFEWTNGVLVFERVPLHAVVADLERAYDVTITITDSALAARKIAVTFQQQTVDEVMTTLSMLLDATYARTGKAVTLSPRRRARLDKRLPSPPVAERNMAFSFSPGA